MLGSMLTGTAIRTIAFGLLLGGLASRGFAGNSTPEFSTQTPATVSTLMKPELYKKMLADREIYTHASLSDLPGSGGIERYSFYAAMVVDASLPRTREVLTDYKLYAKLIPYVSRADYSQESRVLEIQGGILGYVLRSFVRFEEKGPRWIHYEIVGGHFLGMSGNILFESAGIKGTTVYFDGRLDGRHWPPRFVVERGAEIVFGFTARKMRSYIESHVDGGGQIDKGIPQPRKRL